jgi:hypothetical protein
MEDRSLTSMLLSAPKQISSELTASACSHRQPLINGIDTKETLKQMVWWMWTLILSFTIELFSHAIETQLSPGLTNWGVQAKSHYH